MAFENTHFLGAPVVGTDSGGPDQASITAVNPSPVVITTTQQLTMSSPWINAGNADGSPTIGTSLSEPCVIGSTALTISSDGDFPLDSGYPNVHQQGVGFLPPEIGRLAGAIVDDTQVANVILTGPVPAQVPFSVSINGGTYLVNSVSASADGNTAVLTIDDSTPIYASGNPDLSPVHLTALQVGSSYSQFDVPYFYLTQPLIAGQPTPSISVTPLPIDMPAGITLALQFGDYIETCLVGEPAFAGDTQLALASVTFSGIGTGANAIAMTTGTTTVSTYSNENGGPPTINIPSDVADVANLTINTGSTLGLGTNTLLLGGAAGAALTATAFSSATPYTGTGAPTSPNTLSFNAQLVLVAGGGGGFPSGGGGGGGAVTQITDFPVTLDSPMIATVGAGGAVGQPGGTTSLGVASANGGGAGTKTNGGASGQFPGGTGAANDAGGGASPGGAGLPGSFQPDVGLMIGGTGRDGIVPNNMTLAVSGGGGGYGKNLSGSGGLANTNPGGGGDFGDPGQAGLLMLLWATADYTGIPTFSGFTSTPIIENDGANSYVVIYPNDGTGTVTFSSSSGSNLASSSTVSSIEVSFSQTTVSYTELYALGFATALTDSGDTAFTVQPGQVLIGSGVPPGTFVVSVAPTNTTSAGTFVVNQPCSFNAVASAPTVWLTTAISSITAQETDPITNFLITNSPVPPTAECTYYGIYTPTYTYNASTGGFGEITYQGGLGTVVLEASLTQGQFITLTSGANFTGTLLNGSPNITNVSNMNGLAIDQEIVGLGIPYGSLVQSFSGTTITMTIAAESNQTNIDIFTVGEVQTLVVSENAGQFDQTVQVETFSPYYPFDDTCDLIAPYQFSLGTGPDLEYVYPITLPMSMNVTGAAPYNIDLAFPTTITRHAVGTTLDYYELPENPAANTVVYHPDTQDLTLWDGTLEVWRPAKIDSVRGVYSVKGSPGGGDKSLISFADSTSGDTTATDIIANANSTTPSTITGGLRSTGPDGNAWTPASLTSAVLNIQATIPQSGVITYQSMSTAVTYRSAPQPSRVWVGPSDNVTIGPGLYNYINWTYSDLDGDKQSNWTVKVFDQFTYQSYYFNPDTSIPVFTASGQDTADTYEIPSNIPLTSGEQYWVYVKVAKQFNNQPWYGNYESYAFTVTILQPQPALLSVFPDIPNNSNRLLIQTSDNLLSDDNAEFTNSIGGWKIDTNDSAWTTLYDGETGNVTGADLSTKQVITSLPIGATGYLWNPISSTLRPGNRFAVSASTSKKKLTTGFPASGDFLIFIGNETIKVHRVKNSTIDIFSIVERGALNTTPGTHAAKSVVTFGLQEDIYAGYTGQLKYVEVLTDRIPQADKRITIPNTAVPSLATTSDTIVGTLTVVTGTNGTKNANKIIVADPNDVLKNSPWPDATVEFNTSTSSAAANVTSPLSLGLDKKKSLKKVVTAKTLPSTESITITDVNAGKPTPATSTTKNVLIGTTARAINGGFQVNTSAANGYSYVYIDSIDIHPNDTSTQGLTLPAGTEILLINGSYNSHVTLAKAVTFASNADTPTVTLHVNKFDTLPGWHAGTSAIGSTPQTFTVPTGTQILYPKTTKTAAKKNTNKTVTFKTTTNNGQKKRAIYAGDKLTLSLTRTTTSTAPTTELVKQPDKVVTTYRQIVQEFTVAANAGSNENAFISFSSGTLIPVTITADVLNNSSSLLNGANLGGLTIGAILANEYLPPGTQVTGISGTTIYLSNAAAGTATGTTITTSNFIQVGSITSATAVSTNQFQNYVADMAGLPVNSLVVANTSCSANSTFSITLNTSGFVPFTDSTFSTPDYTLPGGVILEPSDGFQNLAYTIPAGSTSIPVVPFTPDYNFKKGTSVVLRCPVPFGEEALIVSPSLGTQIVGVDADGSEVTYTTSTPNKLLQGDVVSITGITDFVPTPYTGFAISPSPAALIDTTTTIDVDMYVLTYPDGLTAWGAITFTPVTAGPYTAYSDEDIVRIFLTANPSIFFVGTITSLTNSYVHVSVNINMSGTGTYTGWTLMPEPYYCADTSNASVAFTAGQHQQTVNLTLAENLQYAAGQWVFVYASTTNYMYGKVTSYDPTTGAFVFNAWWQWGSGSSNGLIADVNPPYPVYNDAALSISPPIAAGDISLGLSGNLTFVAATSLEDFSVGQAVDLYEASSVLSEPNYIAGIITAIVEPDVTINITSSSLTGTSATDWVMCHESFNDSDLSFTIDLDSPASSLSATIDTGQGYYPKQPVWIYQDANNYILGQVTSYNQASGDFVADLYGGVGTGTYTSGWTIDAYPPYGYASITPGPMPVIQTIFNIVDMTTPVSEFTDLGQIDYFFVLTADGDVWQIGATDPNLVDAILIGTCPGTAICINSSGNLFILDGSTIYQMTQLGVVTTFATGVCPTHGGAWMAIDVADNIYVTPRNYNDFTLVNPSGGVSVITTWSSLDPTNEDNWPNYVDRIAYSPPSPGREYDPLGNVIYGISQGSGIIYQISLSGTLTVLGTLPAGCGGGVTSPFTVNDVGIAVDPSTGYLYVSLYNIGPDYSPTYSNSALIVQVIPDGPVATTFQPYYWIGVGDSSSPDADNAGAWTNSDTPPSTGGLIWAGETGGEGGLWFGHPNDGTLGLVADDGQPTIELVETVTGITALAQLPQASSPAEGLHLEFLQNSGSGNELIYPSANFGNDVIPQMVMWQSSGGLSLYTFFADSTTNNIEMVDGGGTITTFVSNPYSGFGGGTIAGMTTDGYGTLYISGGSSNTSILEIPIIPGSPPTAGTITNLATVSGGATLLCYTYNYLYAIQESSTNIYQIAISGGAVTSVNTRYFSFAHDFVAIAADPAGFIYVADNTAVIYVLAPGMPYTVLYDGSSDSVTNAIFNMVWGEDGLVPEGVTNPVGFNPAQLISGELYITQPNLNALSSLNYPYGSSTTIYGPTLTLDYEGELTGISDSLNDLLTEIYVGSGDAYGVTVLYTVDGGATPINGGDLTNFGNGVFVRFYETDDYTNYIAGTLTVENEYILDVGVNYVIGSGTTAATDWTLIVDLYRATCPDVVGLVTGPQTITLAPSQPLAFEVGDWAFIYNNETVTTYNGIYSTVAPTVVQYNVPDQYNYMYGQITAFAPDWSWVIFTAVQVFINPNDGSDVSLTEVSYANMTLDINPPSPMPNSAGAQFNPIESMNDFISSYPGTNTLSGYLSYSLAEPAQASVLCNASAWYGEYGSDPFEYGRTQRGVYEPVSGNLYYADDESKIHQIDPTTGATSVIFDLSTYPNAPYVEGIATYGGNLYVLTVEVISSVNNTVVHEISTSGSYISAYFTGLSASYPFGGIAFDSTGIMYLSGEVSGNGVIYKNGTGILTTALPTSVASLLYEPVYGFLFALANNDNVYKITLSGTVTTYATVDNTHGDPLIGQIASDSSGSLYVVGKPVTVSSWIYQIGHLSSGSEVRALYTPSYGITSGRPSDMLQCSGFLVADATGSLYIDNFCYTIEKIATAILPQFDFTVGSPVIINPGGDSTTGLVGTLTGLTGSEWTVTVSSVFGSGSDSLTGYTLMHTPVTTSYSGSLTISGSGTTSLTVGTGLGYVPNEWIYLQYDLNNYIVGQVASYDPTTGDLVVTNQSATGSGTHTLWNVSPYLTGPPPGLYIDTSTSVSLDLLHVLFTEGGTNSVPFVFTPTATEPYSLVTVSNQYRWYNESSPSTYIGGTLTTIGTSTLTFNINYVEGNGAGLTGWVLIDEPYLTSISLSMTYATHQGTSYGAWGPYAIGTGFEYQTDDWVFVYGDKYNFLYGEVSDYDDSGNLTLSTAYEWGNGSTFSTVYVDVNPPFDPYFTVYSTETIDLTEVTEWIDNSGSYVQFVFTASTPLTTFSVGEPVILTDSGSSATSLVGYIEALSYPSITINVTGATGSGSSGTWVLNHTSTIGTFTDTLSIGACTTDLGSITETTQTGLGYVDGDWVYVYGDSADYFVGQVTAYNYSTGVISIQMYLNVGSGTYTSWTITPYQPPLGLATVSVVPVATPISGSPLSGTYTVQSVPSPTTFTVANAHNPVCGVIIDGGYLGGYVEITTKGVGRPLDNDADAVEVIPGTTYGLLGWSRVINGLSTPGFQPYILWYDQFGNEIYWDYGINSLTQAPIPIQSITGNGHVATVITVAPHGLTHNQYVIIRGNSFAGYNDLFQINTTNFTRWVQITPTGPTTFTFATTLTTQGVGGEAYVVNPFETAVTLNSSGAATALLPPDASAVGHGWTPNVITGVAPANFVVANECTYTSITGGTDYTGQFSVPGGINTSLTAGTQLTASNGVVYTLEDTVPYTGQSTVLQVRFQPELAGSQTFKAILTANEDVIYAQSPLPFIQYQVITGPGIPANTFITAIAGNTLTLNNLATSTGTYTLTSYGNSMTGVSDLTISAAYAVPAFSWNNAVGSDIYGLAGVIFKALTSPIPNPNYTEINSLIPVLDAPLANAPGSVSNALTFPSSTPTEGFDTVYLFDPAGDFGTREIHQGVFDPELWTTTTAPSKAGDKTISLLSISGLAVGAELLLDWGGPFEESVTVDTSWSGSTTVNLVKALAYAHTKATQVYALVAGISGSLYNTQALNTPVAVMSWNNAGWVDTSGSDNYYFTVERSENEGTSWTTLPGGGNVQLDATGVARIDDNYVIPGAPTYYRITGYYDDTWKSSVTKATTTTLIKGVPTVPLYAPMPETDVWWLCSTSNKHLRFPILVQNAYQETQKHPVGVFYPLSASRPYTIAGVVQGRDATIDIIWTDNLNWNRFLSMLNLGEILVLIDPVEQRRVYIFISDDVTVTHQSSVRGPYRDVKIVYVESAPPGSGFTYGY